MKYQAVIFDLFGTLVDAPTREKHRKVLETIASILSVPHDDFSEMWFDTAAKRGVGDFKDLESNIKYICEKLGAQCEDNQMKNIVQIRMDYTIKIMQPRIDAIEVLSQLRADGYKTGLISNCSPEVPIVWKDKPLAPLIEVAIFSCSVGQKKPEPSIYELAAVQLGVDSRKCLYIGDGDSQELTGALQVGMHPVLIRVPYESNANTLVGYREEWNGPVISSLSEVLTLVK